MISEKSKAWIKAAEMVGGDSTEKVTCPNCGHEFLKVEKVPWPNFDKVDIYLSCEKCSARNVITTSTMHKS